MRSRRFQAKSKDFAIFRRTSQVLGLASTVRYAIERREACPLSTTVCDCIRAEFACANIRNPQENRPTFHLQEDQ